MYRAGKPTLAFKVQSFFVLKHNMRHKSKQERDCLSYLWMDACGSPDK